MIISATRKSIDPMIRNLLILILVALLVLVATENHRLIARNRKLVRGIHEVVKNNSAHIPGYIEPEDVIKDIYIRELTRR